MKKFFAVLVCISLLLMSGCVASEGENDGNGIIAVSFYPVYIFTINLTDGIDGVDVQCMAEQNTGCLHDYTLTARDVRLLSDADMLIINGAGMETFLDDLSETTRDLPIVDSSVGVELLCEEEHGEHEEHSHDHHHENNSHIWMSVENAQKQVLNIKNGLEKHYPEYKEQIENNYKAYTEKLDLLKSEVNEVKTFSQGAEVIAFHGAYEYIANDIGFEIYECIESDEGAEPSAKKLTYLCKEIEQNGIKALFTSPDYDGNAADILASETGVDVYCLNPFVNGEKVPTAYEDVMRENIEIIKKAVS